MLHNNQISNIRVTRLLIHETGTFNQQYRRPYETHLEGSTMNALMERLVGAKKYVPSLMAGVANQFVTPSATPEKPIQIAQGWNERRMRFMMEVEYDVHMGGRMRENILGYTNYSGVSQGGHVDPQMEFTVNSIVHVKDLEEMTPMGRVAYTNVTNSAHVLADNNFGGLYAPEKDQRMRPMDVYATMGVVGLGSADVYDGRAVSSTQAVLSRRSNNSPANYMASVLQNYASAYTTADSANTTTEILTAARGNAAEPLIARDKFLQAINSVRNMGMGSVFTWGELMALDPNVESVTEARLLGETTNAHQTGMTCEWGGSDGLTQKASYLSQSIPALMMELALTGIRFRSSNDTYGGVVQTMIMDYLGFNIKANMQEPLRIFVERLEFEILKDISYDGQIRFQLEMHVDLLGETLIRISMDGSPMIDYVTPSFCDALMVPVLTSDANRAMTLASDFDALTGQLQSMATPTDMILSAGGTAFGNI